MSADGNGEQTLGSVVTLLETAEAEDGVDSPGRVDTSASIAARFGRYVILRKLGEGGMGRAYAAYDEKLDRKVAIKLLRSHDDARARSRLVREAKAMARLSHPNVAQVYEIDESGGQAFMVVEFVDGVTLAQWLRDEHRSLDEILAAFHDAGRGLASAHAQGIVHRDFKPDNVMIRRYDGRILVMDFGLAHGDRDEQPKATDPSNSSDLAAELTATGSLMGTPAYMAPEQFSGGKTTPKTDQFSFCVALWEALYGQRPFVAQSLPALARAVMEGDVTSVSSGQVPAWIRNILHRGLATKPEQRWPTMESLLEALHDDPIRGRRRQLFAGIAMLGTDSPSLSPSTIGPTTRVSAFTSSRIASDADRSSTNEATEARTNLRLWRRWPQSPSSTRSPPCIE